MRSLTIYVKVFNFLSIQIRRFDVITRGPLALAGNKFEFKISGDNIRQGVENGLVA